MEAEYKQDPAQFVQKYQLDLDQSNLQSFDELDPEVLKTVFAEKAWHYRVAHDKEVADNIAEVQKITDGKVLNLYGIEHGMDFDDGKTKGYRGKKDLDGYLEDLGLKPNVIGLAGNPDNINAVLKSFNLAEIPNTIIFTGTAAGEDKVNGPCGVYQLTEERSSFRPGTVRSESRPSIRDIVRKEVLSPLGETTLISETPSKLDNVEWKAITPFQLEQLKIKAEIQK
jgi:hypothetical protein